jgi:hypothetical protein
LVVGRVVEGAVNEEGVAIKALDPEIRTDGGGKFGAESDEIIRGQGISHIRQMEMRKKSQRSTSLGGGALSDDLPIL